MTSSSSFKFFLFVFVAIMAISSSFVDAADGTCDEATPCQNGGTCHFDDIRQVNYCHCPQGTAGKLCHGTNCPLTCRNGGSCRNGADDGGLEFFCECVGGYSGDSCECAPGNDCGSSSAEVQVPASTSTGSSSSSSEKNGMNGFGKFLVSMVVIGSVIMFGFVLLRRRRYSSSSNTGLDKDSAIREAETYEDSVGVGSPTYKDSAGDVEDAVKSIEQQQQASSFGGKGGQSTSETTADILDGMDDVEDYN